MNNTHYKGNYCHPHSQKLKKKIKGFATRFCKIPFFLFFFNALYAVLPIKTSRFGNLQKACTLNLEKIFYKD